MKNLLFSASVFGVLLVGSISSRGLTIDLPNSLEQGSATTAILPVSSRAMQWVVSSNLLSGLSRGDIITGISFRLDGASTLLTPITNTTWTRWDLQLSQSLNKPGQLSTNFAENIGADLTTVRSGPLTILANSFVGSPASPEPFGPTITFSTPYAYQKSDLIFTLRVESSIVFGISIDSAGPTPTADYQGWIGVGAYDLLSGNGRLGVPAFELTYMHVPEPTVFALAAFGIVGILCAHSRPKK